MLRQKQNNKNINDLIWINNPHYHKNILTSDFYRNKLKDQQHVFINCCNHDTAKFLSELKYETIKVGKEAILKLDCEHFSGRRLKESIKAGLRHGEVKEYQYCKENILKLEKFKAICKHSREPQLKLFFNDKFKTGNRLFVLENKNKEWLGALLISQINNETVETDLILRRENAPNGVMEALIYKTFLDLKNEGCKKWSLGEVPYIVYDSKLFSKEYFINVLGRKSKFAYNYSGLYKFKNKFNPVWNDVFICAKSGLNFSLLFKILIQSNLIFLILQKAFTAFFQINT